MARVRGLESSLTKKMMSADLKIVQTVKENDKLRQRLHKIYAALDKEKIRQSNLEQIISSLKQQSRDLTILQESLADVKSSVLQLESSSDLQLESSQPFNESLRNHSPPALIDTGKGRSIKFVRTVCTSSGGGSTVRTDSPVAMGTRGDQLRERNEELNRGTHERCY